MSVDWIKRLPAALTAFWEALTGAQDSEASSCRSISPDDPAELDSSSVSRNSTPPQSLRSKHDLISRMEERSEIIRSLDLRASVSDEQLEGSLFNFANSEHEQEKICDAVDSLHEAGILDLKEIKKSLLELLHPGKFDGVFAELATYGWLSRNGVSFEAQIEVDETDLLSRNPVWLDGRIDMGGKTAYFDIKSFAFVDSMIEQARFKLEEKLTGVRISIDGAYDVSQEMIGQFALSRIDELADEISQNGRTSIPELGWMIKAETGNVITSSFSQNPYRQAENNRYLPFRHGKQFSRKHPFILIFAYLPRWVPNVSANFCGSTDTFFRALSRRAFLEWIGSPCPASVACSDADAGSTMEEASSLLSGILYLDLESGNSSLFLNPAARNPLTQYDVDGMFDFQWPDGMQLEDFAHDYYPLVKPEN